METFESRVVSGLNCARVLMCRRSLSAPEDQQDQSSYPGDEKRPKGDHLSHTINGERFPKQSLRKTFELRRRPINRDLLRAYMHELL
jgi:hypothetical protein